jgi:uncharacterized protein
VIDINLTGTYLGIRAIVPSRAGPAPASHAAATIAPTVGASQAPGGIHGRCIDRRPPEDRRSHMKNAKELLEEFTAASFRDPKKAAEMFAEDGAFEMPYLESLGVPGRYEGREAIEGFFRFVREVYPDMDLENVEIMIDTPKQVFAEYEFTAQSSKTGRTIHELFFGRLVAENGKIKLLRESVNLVEVALGVFPNGLADYKAPSEHTA